MDATIPLFSELFDQASFNVWQVTLKLTIATLLGFTIAIVYRRTHTGISYSQGFVISLILVTVISAAAMMVIGNSLARAFGLVGALSIIRYRTVVKDVKDAAYIFLALVTGFACGVGAFQVAVLTDTFVLGIVAALTRYHFGLMHHHDFVLSFIFNRNDGHAEGYREIFERLCRRQTLIHVEPGAAEHSLFLTFDISLREGVDSTALIDELRSIRGVSAVKLISASDDGAI